MRWCLHGTGFLSWCLMQALLEPLGMFSRPQNNSFRALGDLKATCYPHLT